MTLLTAWQGFLIDRALNPSDEVSAWDGFEAGYIAASADVGARLQALVDAADDYMDDDLPLLVLEEAVDIARADRLEDDDG